MTIYENWEELEEKSEWEEWGEDLEEDIGVIVVTFESSSKRYDYFTDEFHFEKGDKILIKNWDRKEIQVTVVGYRDNTSHATKKINIIRKITKNDNNRTNKFKKEEKTNMKNTSKIIENTKEALIDAKDVAMKVQKGSAVIVAIKAALYESNLVPANIKTLVESGNGISDLIIGVILQVAAETFTESEIIKDAASSANLVGAMSASQEFTMLQDTIEKVVGAAIGKVNEKMTASKSEQKKKE